MLFWPSGSFSNGRGIKVALSFWTYSRVVTVLLGGSAKWRNAIISFVMSVCPYKRTFCLLWTDFHEMLYLSILFSKMLEKIRVSLKSDKITVVYLITHVR